MSRQKNIANKATVKTSVIASIALSNLLHKKLRTALTVFGIAIGIGAIFFLLSFGIGIQRLVTDEVIGNQSIKTIDVTSPNSRIIKLDDIATQRISEMPNVSSIGKAYFFPGSFKISSSESDSIVYGIDTGYQNLTYLNLIEGTLLDKSDEKFPIIINVSALEAIGLAGNPNEIIGKTISVIVPLSKVSEDIGTYTQDFVVVGVIDSGSGSEIFIPSDIFKELGVPDLSQLKVGVDDVDTIQSVRGQIESLGFETSSPVDTLDEINNVFKYLNYILVGFGGIGMIVAILGMFNTLTISLLERTKEIGLMVALGARSIDMKRLFILEAMFLSLFGSIVGMFAAFLFGRILNVIMNIFASRRGVQDSFELFATPPILIIGTLAFMVLVGLLVVYLPARRAQKINPIDALRRE
jgi:putative ABC transport system permease protein